MYILENLKYFPKNKIFMKYPTEAFSEILRRNLAWY